MRYSDAPRCTECRGRALMTEEAADALALESLGRLEVFACPHRDGWHVWSPAIEVTHPGVTP